MSLDKTQLRHGEEYYDSGKNRTAYWDAATQLFVVVQKFHMSHITDVDGIYYFKPDKSTGNSINNLFSKKP